jgi:hypothetical protein
MLVDTVSCDSAYKGDLNGNKQHDIEDLELLQSVILPLSQSMRQDYVKCADYDRDGDVDESDLRCLTNVISHKWVGDMNGGVCFDISFDTALKCDTNGDYFIDSEDSVAMRDLVEAANDGVGMTEEILDTCDFDGDERITYEDWECLDYFEGMDLDDPTTLLAGRTIPGKCMNIYNLDKCASIPGDLNGDIAINEIDEILIMLIKEEQITGYDMQCADVNGDGIVTDEDIVCVKSYTAGDLETYYTCINCDESIPEEYRALVEICNDGYDNNCDGLVDRTSTEAAVDDCNCGSHTDCFYNWDNDNGQVPGVDDGNIKVCRKFTWEDNGSAISSNDGYKWVYAIEMQCGEDKECENVECKDTAWKCAFDGTSWDWYENPSDLEAENDDPMGSPKVCEDGYDNDCACGDRECKELESGDMFSSWEFWIGAVLGAALSFVRGLNILVVGLILAALSVGSSLAGCEGCAAFFSGMGMGLSVGSLAQSVYSLGKDAVTTTAQESAQSAVGDAVKEGAAKEALNGVTEQTKDQAINTIKESVSEEAKAELGNQIKQEVADISREELEKQVEDKLTEEATRMVEDKLAEQAAEQLAQEAAQKPLYQALGDAAKDFFRPVTTFSAETAAAGSSIGKMFWGMANMAATGYAAQQAGLEYAKNRAEWVTHAQSCS